jgi:hypothetical protein
MWYTKGMENNEQPLSPELMAQVQALVNVAFSDGVEKAVSQARATGSDDLVDRLHQALSEPATHDELLKRGKVSPAV